MHEALNFALFRAGWFACGLGGANGMPLAAAAATGCEREAECQRRINR